MMPRPTALSMKSRGARLHRREGDRRAEGGVAGSSPAHRHSSLRVLLKSAPYSRATGQPGSSAGIPGPVGRFDRVNISHQGAQPVELVEEMQDDRDAFVVDAEIQFEIPDQPGPREIGIGELKCAPLARGNSHCSSIQKFKVAASTCDRLMNFWVSTVTLPSIAVDCPPTAATARRISRAPDRAFAEASASA